MSDPLGRILIHDYCQRGEGNGSHTLREELDEMQLCYITSVKLDLMTSKLDLDDCIPF